MRSTICGLVVSGLLFHAACAFAAGPKLHFADAERAARYTSLQKCFAAMTQPSPPSPESPVWQQKEPELLGNFFESAWCPASNQSAQCPDDNSFYKLSALTYAFPHVFGLAFDLHHQPLGDGFEVRVAYVENGKSVASDAFRVEFRAHQAGKTGPLIVIPETQYKVAQSFVGVPVAQDALALARQLLSSPEQFQKVGLKQLKQLARNVKTTIAAHVAQTCTDNKYQGSGIPPLCHLRKLTAAEEVTELKKANDYFAVREKILESRAREMYATLVKALPPQKCLP